MTPIDTLDSVFSALADSTRRGILERLSTGPATVGELAGHFSISAPAISQHLRVLENAGLIERSKRAQWRTCTIRIAPLDDVAQWVEGRRGDRHSVNRTESPPEPKPGPKKSAKSSAAAESRGPGKAKKKSKRRG